ncbi:ATP-binding protein [Streptomyces sp. 900116325]
MDTMSVDVATGQSSVSPAGARDRARVFLDSLTRPLAREAAETVVLVVSELVTNALRHGGGTGGFGWPMVNRLARAAVTRQAAGGKTVSALPDR